MSLFGNTYRGRKVLVTGYTGFKGSWLCLWLRHLGAEIIGYSLNPPTDPSHYELLNLDIISVEGDIRDREKLNNIFDIYKPEIIFHLAAQSLVRYSYSNPVETFETNLMGTINVLEACRKSETVRTIVNITSDKCYENRKFGRAYRENDPMGGYDPYSASKGCAELVTSSYRNSFFNPAEYGKRHNILLASARAGNVIGGGDWAVDRLIPDIMRAASKNETVIIRNPSSSRPWQHVLEPLSGYLMLGQKLFQGEKEFAGAWNFGPDNEGNITVESVVRSISQEWDKIKFEMQKNISDIHEARLLKLDCSKAHARLKWRPVWDIKKAISMTAGWYREFYENKSVLSMDNIKTYTQDMDTVYAGR